MGLRDPLSPEQLGARLDDIDGWTRSVDREEIHRTYELDYYTSIKAINDVMIPAKELEHHPDIDLRWSTVHFSLTTYSAGQRLTELDFLLAGQIDRIMKSYNAV